MVTKFRSTTALPLGLMIFALILFTSAHLRYVKVQRAERLFYSFTQHVRRSEFAEAQKDIQTARELQPGNAHYLSNQALLQERSLRRGFERAGFKQLNLNAEEIGQVKRAIEDYRQVLALNPYDDHAYHNLGWLYWFVQQPGPAFDCLRKANAIDSDNELYHLSLGLLHEYCDELRDAHAEYAQALRLSPEILDSRFFLELKERSPNEAERLVEESIRFFESRMQQAPTPILKAKLGRLYLDKQPDKAMQMLSEVTTELPNLFRPWLNLGHLYELQGDEHQMETSYRKVVFLDRYDVLARFRLGRYYDRHDRIREAIIFYRQAVNNWMNQPSTHASRVRRIYLSRFTLRDDVIPEGLSAYFRAAFDMPGTCARLSALYRNIGDQDLSNYYEQLGREYIP